MKRRPGKRKSSRGEQGRAARGASGRRATKTPNRSAIIRSPLLWLGLVLCGIVAAAFLLWNDTNKEQETPIATEDSAEATGEMEKDGNGGQSKRPDSVVLVVVDTLRADVLSFLGHDRSTSPFLDTIAEDAIVFTNAYAPSSWTAPSMASLMTSVFPSSHGAVANTLFDEEVRAKYGHPVLNDTFVTLAELFKNAGYKTVGVAANRYLSSSFGYPQGFDAYYPTANFLNASKLNQTAAVYLERLFGKNWAESWRSSKSFVWLHYFDPHGPYFPRSPWIDKLAPDYKQRTWWFPPKKDKPGQREIYENPGVDYKKQALPYYESEILYWDFWFKQIAKKLKLINDNTLFVFTSDHGDELGEHGGLEHSKTLYEEIVHIPLLFYWPNGFGDGRTIDTPVSLVDVYPTLAEIAGIETPPVIEGKSLLPLMRDEGDGRRRTALLTRPLFMENREPKPKKKAILHGGWKLIVSESNKGVVTDELFNLAEDPGERHNLAHADTERAAMLKRTLDRIVKKLPPPPKPIVRTDLDTALHEQLENLGYVDSKEKAENVN